jgi:ABC-2 type transport system permease protein
MIWPAWTIAKRELKSLFVSPIAYVILGIFSLISAFHFLMSLETFDKILKQAKLQVQFSQNTEILNQINLNEMLIAQVVSFTFFLFLFTLPGITMGGLAEERKQGTYELLFTSPISTWDIILGKLMAAFAFFFVIVATQIVFLVVVFKFGNPEMGPVLSAYLGLALCALVILAVGLFTSSLTTNQIIAYFSAIFILLGLLMVGWASKVVPGNLATFFEGASIQTHFEGFNRGVISVSSIVYFITTAIFFTAATNVSLDSLTRK